MARKLVRLGGRAALHLNTRTYRSVAKGAESTVIFDEMETFEHTKCKPISIALAVAGSTREVISVAVAKMPASGNLSTKARNRYGRRRDGRIKAMRQVITEVARLCPNVAIVKSDKCSRYPKIVSDLLPKSVVHEVYKGRRGCVTGQGELKRGGWDPLFTLNHTCAMFRDRVKRLARKTWCTTKRLDRLSHLINLYAWWHNKLVTGKRLPFHMP
ncbi:MAG: hypothetical protein FJ146_16570 [Deltaproteobacteria bacterium]|nr:hypothetical protein [Deltaproteobacteria bacterium]